MCKFDVGFKAAWIPLESTHLSCASENWSDGRNTMANKNNGAGHRESLGPRVEQWRMVFSYK